MQKKPPDYPETVKTSLASALSLRFLSGRFYRDAGNFCINLLLNYPDDCRANCAYCGLAHSRPQNEDSFIRVDWPVLKTRDVLDRLSRYSDTLHRICISTVFHPNAVKDTVSLATAVRAVSESGSGTPLSVLITPGLFGAGDLERLKVLGADYLGVGLDAASKRVFEATRGKKVGGPLSWEDYIATLTSGVKAFGDYKVSCHIMVGIGETDRELVECFYHVHDMKALIHLFSFYPEPRSVMAGRKRPSMKRFRRAQLMAYLVEKNLIGRNDLEFDAGGRLIHIKNSLAEVVEEAIECGGGDGGGGGGGKLFITGGCPSKDGDIGCNRPFGSYRPGESFRDFPFHPEPEDIRRSRRELRLDELFGNGLTAGRKKRPAPSATRL